MRILFAGDVIAKPGLEAVQRVVPNLRREYKVDLVIPNGENAANGFGPWHG